MKKHFTFLMTFILSIVLMACSIRTYAWGGDIIVNPVAGRYYSSAKISVAYDQTIYYARLYSTTVGGPIQNWEVLKSTDHGLTFSFFVGQYLSGSDIYVSLDIVAAGNNAGDFGLFLASSYKDSILNVSHIYLNKFDAAGSSSNLMNETYSYSNILGFSSVCVVSDYRQKNTLSSPYSISVAAVKSTPINDSIIIWTDEVGGSVLHRKAVASTSRFFRNVSIAVGSASSTISVYGRLGITYDEYQELGDTLGAVKAKIIFPDDGGDFGGTIYLGADTFSCRNPCIIMSQSSTESIIKAMVMFETTALSHMIINSRVCDNVIAAGVPDFTGYPIVSSLNGNNLYPYGIFDPVNANFLITFLNTTTNSLTYSLKTLSSPSNDNPVFQKANYRDASTSSSIPVKPRIDIDLTNMQVVCGWNDSYSSMLDAENSSASIADLTQEGQTYIQLYPNPAKEFVTIKTSVDEDYTITLYNLAGQPILENTFSGNEYRINLENIPQGCYIMKITSASASSTEKLIVR
jgi:hypothetical protein